jgi:beta-glucosidase-like glycosyl hydrolase/CubicO group peptidase (beta-lactamase class C family)
MRRFLYLTILFLLISATSFSQVYLPKLKKYSPVVIPNRLDSILNTLSLRQKVGQLFMIAAFSNRGDAHTERIDSIIKDCGVGGIIFFKGTPYKQALLTNHYQSISKTPMFIGIDGEWGVAMRLDSSINYPKQMTLGSIKNDSLIYEFGRAVGKECKRLGIHINFAPSVDINNNPNNPVIHMRSFGESKIQVANKGVAYMKGMQDEGIIAVGKHFPGHGDTEVDSHKDLPILYFDSARIDSLELFPFKALIKNGVKGIMVAHLNIPSLGLSDSIPSTLSSYIIKEMLNNNLGFNGLVFTDALNMTGARKKYKDGEIEIKALQAGNDILVYSANVTKAVDTIVKAVEAGIIPVDYLNLKVKKIITQKYVMSLFNRPSIDLNNITNDINNPQSELLKRKLIESSLTLVKNDNQLFPIKDIANKKIIVISIDSSNNTFLKTLSNYTTVIQYPIKKGATKKELIKFYRELPEYDLAIISITRTNSFNIKNFGLNDNIISFFNLFKTDKTLLVNFGSAYILRYFTKFTNILQVYQDDPDFQEIAAEAIFSAIPVDGRLPVNVTSSFQINSGIPVLKTNRLKYTIPEEVGISSISLKSIDSIAESGIKIKAFPGCQILVAKDNKVIYHKSFGKFTYDSSSQINDTDIYDIASVTKIAATLLTVMKLYETKQIKLKDSLLQYIPKIEKTNKSNIRIEELLTHTAGLQSWISLYKSSQINNNLNPLYYSNILKWPYTTEVAKGLYLHKSFQDTIWKIINRSKLNERGKYVYSDLCFILLKKAVENKIKIPYTLYLDSFFYKPLGMNQTLFNPLTKFDTSRIVPTEIDDYYRNREIRGFVHDPAAAMMGGIAGHAGLFSNSNDLAKLMQMFLNNGTYGGKRYFDTATIQLFTSQYLPGIRRGLGFDKPETDKTINGPTCKSASPLTFGHTGFTGCCVWADPKYNLIFIFLSNRTYPTQKNKKLSELNIRTDIQEIIYKSLPKTQ